MSEKKEIILDEYIERLRVIAKGEYCSMSASYTIYSSGKKELEFAGYIHGYNWTPFFNHPKSVIDYYESKLNLGSNAVVKIRESTEE